MNLDRQLILGYGKKSLIISVTQRKKKKKESKQKIVHLP